MAQNFINGILIPEDGEPRRVALETDGRGLMGDALSRLVGGCFDTLPIVIPGVDLWVNDDGTSEFGPNRAIYATRAMEERPPQPDRLPARPGRRRAVHDTARPDRRARLRPEQRRQRLLTEEQAETVTEYFTETSPAGSGLLENLRLRLGLPSFAADPTDTSDPTGIATSSDVVTPSMKGL